MPTALRSLAVLPACLTAIACWMVATTPAGTVAFADDEESEEERRLKMHYYFKGRHIFESQCVPCHGTRGGGDGPWAEGLTDRPRNFRTGVFKFRTTPYGKLPTEDDLRRTIRSGISGTAMPFFAKLTDADVDGLIVYLQSFSKRWDDDEAHAEPLDLPETPDWFRDPQDLAEHAEAGGARFAELCASCHGETGEGNGPASQNLVDTWGHPIVPADLTNEHHKSGDAPSDLYRTIATGLDGTPMVGFYEALTEVQIWDLVAFIKHNEVDGRRADENQSTSDR